jgi:hypothetical protein
MDLVNVAYNGASHPLTGLQYGLSAMVLALPVGLLVLMFVAQARLRAAGRFEGPALTGTAQLLSADRAGGLAAFAGDARGPGIVGRIGLRVSIRGRPPYDVTVTRKVGNTWLYYARRWPAGTYAVQVDSANPENVRFDYMQPMTMPAGGPWMPGWYPDPWGAQAQRYWDGRKWTASVQPHQRP